MQLSVSSGLQAHFNQPAGPSRPGTDWVVQLKEGSVERRLMVRTYADRTKRLAANEHAAAAIAYVSQLLEGGWSANESDQVLPLVVPDDFVAPTVASSSKPWWKFW